MSNSSNYLNFLLIFTRMIFIINSNLNASTLNLLTYGMEYFQAQFHLIHLINCVKNLSADNLIKLNYLNLFLILKNNNLMPNYLPNSNIDNLTNLINSNINSRDDKILLTLYFFPNPNSILLN